MNVLLAFGWPVAETVVERLGWVLVHSLWQFASVALLAGVTIQALRRRSAVTRYGVLVVAMTLLVAAPVTTWIIQPGAAPDSSAGPGANAPGQASNAATSSGADAARLARLATLARDPERGVPPPDSAASSALSETGPGGSKPASAMMQRVPSWSHRVTAFLRPWLVWIVAGWSLGVVLCSLRPLLGWYTLRRLQRVGLSPVADEVLATLQRLSGRLGLRRAVRLLQSTLARVPVVVGYVRPVILLPVRLVTSLPGAQLETILAHELAHVLRHDFVINLLQTLVETLFFYHPAVWWLSREIRIEREHCCDDLVVMVLGNRVEYGRALVAVEELRGRNTVLALGATDGSLLSRVRRIVGVGFDPNALSLVGRWPAALLGLLLIGVVGILTTNWQAAANDDTQKTAKEQAANDQPGDNTYGPEANGLRCRLVAVPTTADDTSPDLTKPANAFARGDDVTFAVELKNVSDKAVTLLGVRHHTPRQPAFDGKLAPEFFAPHLFEFDFADANGGPVPRPSRVFFGMNDLLNGASAHEVAPGRSLVVVLRPARFHSPMDYRLPPGTYRAKVRYRGPSDSTWARFRENSPDSPQAKAWSKEVSSNEETFTIARDPSTPRPAKLVWGEVKDGLQAAVEFRSPPGVAATTDPPGTLPAKPYVSTVFHVKNVSDHIITFVSETGRQGDEVTATNEAGETQQLQSVFFTGVPIVVRWTLKPGEVAELQALAGGIGLLDKPGKYTLRYHVNFANLVQNKGAGEFGFPKKDDWQQVLVTGDTPVTIRSRTAEDDAREQPVKPPAAGSTPKPTGDAKADAIAPNGEIVGRLLDAATGKPVAGATVACGAIINDSGKGGGANVVTNADGLYRLAVPSPGIYIVWLKKFDKDPTMTAAADDGLLVEAGKVAASGLTLVVGRKVTGKVVDADGKPFADLNVSCHSLASPPSGGVQSTTTKAEGTFEFFLPPGRAYVYAYEPVAQTKDNPFGVGRSAHVHFKVPATEDVVPITLTLQMSESKFGDAKWLNRSTPGTQIVRREGNQNVTGTVVDESGKPIAGAKVFPEDGPLVATNDKGEFRMETMKGTQFVMHAFAPGYHVWFGTPTSGDVLKIVLEAKERPGAEPGPGEPASKPTEGTPDGKKASTKG